MSSRDVLLLTAVMFVAGLSFAAGRIVTKATVGSAAAIPAESSPDRDANQAPLAASMPITATISPAEALLVSSRLSACIRTMRLKRCFWLVRWLTIWSPLFTVP